MQSMRWFVMVVLLPLSGFAKPWNGIAPGQASKLDIIAKFGEPSKVVTVSGREVLAYLKDKAIRGTTQAQFKLDPKTGLLERIDVFPSVELKLKDIEASYGSECPKGTNDTVERPCYLKRDDGKKQYVVYQRLGLAIFFKEDGQSVQSFTFLPEKKS